MNVGGILMKRHQTNQMTPLIMNTTCDSWLISHGLSSKSWRQTNTPGESLCSPVWEEQLLRRSIIVSAWISLILLRSAARLYSICSACVRGITCLSCTCANPNTALINHNSNKTWSKSKIWFKGVPKNICFLPFPLLYDGPQRWRKRGRPSTVCH